MYNCQTGGRGRRWGGLGLQWKKKTDTRSQKFWLLIDFFLMQMGKKRELFKAAESVFLFLITTTVEPVGNVGW